VLAHPPLHEVPTADLTQARQYEQPSDDEQPLHPFAPPGIVRPTGRSVAIHHARRFAGWHHTAGRRCPAQPSGKEDRPCWRRTRPWCDA
jgi:hypothetical protein